MATVAILSLDNIDLHNDSRVLRQIKYLSNEYAVDVIAFGDPSIPINVNCRSIKYVGSLKNPKWKRQIATLSLLTLGRFWPSPCYEKWFWSRPGHAQALDMLTKTKYNVIHANEWWTLPIAITAARKTGARVVLDLHEYALDEFHDRLWWRWLYPPVIKHYLNRYMRQVNAVITVNGMIASRYEEEYGVSPLVVMNAPDANPDVVYRSVHNNEIQLIHHGAAVRVRNLELMIKAASLLDSRYHLTMMLFWDETYIHELEQYAQKVAPGRVTFRPPVDPKNVVNVLQDYDMGIFLLEPKGFNYLATLPNKFFEYVNAGLAVITGPSPEMMKLGTQYGFGLASQTNDPSDVACILNSLTIEQIDSMKQKSVAASECLNAGIEMGKLSQLYRDLLTA